jgi:hypothetical protein
MTNGFLAIRFKVFNYPVNKTITNVFKCLRSKIVRFVAPVHKFKMQSCRQVVPEDEGGFRLRDHIVIISQSGVH